MVTFVIGGSGSGKSEFAESILDGYKGRKYYIATMKIYDHEMEEKAARHRYNRRGRNFETIECPLDISGVNISGGAVLIECLTNLAANELFLNGLSSDMVFENIKNGIERLCRQACETVIVSGDVFEGGAAYGTETKEYMEVLGKINGFCASMSDMVIEVVYSIPIYHKYPTDTDDMFNKGPYL
ncbi:bifunctional adenosylcobinamide kinase/adenosylcobinamide-phosphate guanylyltransferase [Anaerotignum faecicola]|nr:bifunctional adenosylcobinamide kinase/adenosylcobinamide-phosphate guanylyltransferase [Anaerotignum faecicola]